MDKKSFIQELGVKGVLVLLLAIGYFLFRLFLAVKMELIDWNIAILVICIVVGFLILTYLHRVYKEQKKKKWPDVSRYLYNKENKTFLLGLRKVFMNNQNKESLIENFKRLLEKHKMMTQSYHLSQIVIDIECHFGLFDSETIDYRFAGDPLTFEEGNTRFLQIIDQILNAREALYLDLVYERYTRWINDEGLRLEVSIVDRSNAYTLYKTIDSDTYFFEVMIHKGVGSWMQTFKVDNSLKPRLKTALEEKNQEDLKYLANFVSR